MCLQMLQASHTAGFATASMGKFDKRVKGEKDGERSHISKKRHLVAQSNTDTGEELKTMGKMADKMVREKSDVELDVGKAVSKLEADKRRKRHSEKIKGTLAS